MAADATAVACEDAAGAGAATMASAAHDRAAMLTIAATIRIMFTMVQWERRRRGGQRRRVDHRAKAAESLARRLDLSFFV